MNARASIALGLTLLGAGLVGYAGVAWTAAALYERSARLAFADQRALPARLPAPPESSGPGSLVGELEAPRVGLRVMVIEGDSEQVLSHGAGHVPGTALPGGEGNVAIAAHRDSWFRPLQGVRIGDVIALTTMQGGFQYRVTAIDIVDPADVAVMAPTPTPTLTLITCYPFYYVGPAPRRYIVRAALIGKG